MERCAQAEYPSVAAYSWVSFSLINLMDFSFDIRHRGSQSHGMYINNWFSMIVVSRHIVMGIILIDHYHGFSFDIRHRGSPSCSMYLNEWLRMFVASRICLAPRTDLPGGVVKWSDYEVSKRRGHPIAIRYESRLYDLSCIRVAESMCGHSQGSFSRTTIMDIRSDHGCHLSSVHAATATVV